LQRPTQHAFVVATVVDAAGTVGERKVRWPDKVSPTNLYWIEPERPPHFFDRPLGNKPSLRSARATVWTGWARGGKHAEPLGKSRRDSICPGGEVAHSHGWRRPRMQLHAAAIVNAADLQSVDLSIGSEASVHQVHLVATLKRERQVLTAGGHPADRSIEPH